MTAYYFGHSPTELERLRSQAAVLRPITERLLRSAGLREGMRVLDVGCGAGDVSFLAAEMVGTDGVVLGIDRSAEAVALSNARRRHVNVAFRQGGEDDVDPAAFDFVVSRYVLLHQLDPVAFLRTLAMKVKPGGIIACHEIDMRAGFGTLPPAPRFDTLAAEVVGAIKAAVPNPDVAGRLAASFVAAGLPPPNLFCERPAGSFADPLIPLWIVACVASIRALADPNAPTLDVNQMSNELLQELSIAHSQVLGSDQCCASVAV